MKLFVVVGLLCLVGLSVSYPSDERRVLRRRNSAAQIRARRPEPARFVPTVVEPPAEYEREQEEETFARRQSRPTPNKRRIPVAEVAPSHVRQDNAVAASEDSYNGRGYEAGSYESDRVKFEQSVQQSANSYNSDHGVTDGRLNFAIAGQQGPHSYRFGYDTGKGADRVFRFEEKDAAGVIYGRYGYYDPTGKFRIVNYKAHPEHGFQAEGNYAPK